VGFIVFLIASLIAIIWQANVASKERDNAVSEALKVENVNKFLQDMLSSVDPTEAGKDVKVYDVLKKASENIGNDFTKHPEIEAAVRKTIGKTLTNLGEFNEAKSHLIKSLELNNKVYGKESYQSAESMHELALCYHWIGDLNLADSLYAKSIKIFRQNEDSPPRAFASTLNDFGILKQDQAKFSESLNLLKEAYNIFKNNFGEKDRDVASTLNNLALTLESLNDIDGAEKYYQKSLEVYLELFGPNRPEISTLYNNLAYIYIDKEDLNKAEKYFKKSLELKIKTFGRNHSLVGLAFMNLGSLEYTMKNFESSESNLLNALENFKTSLNEKHVWVGLAYYWYGKILIEKSKYLEAENYLRKSLLINEKNYPPDHPNIISSSAELGIVSFHLNRFAESEKLLVYGYNGVKKIKGEKNHNTIRILEYLVKLLEKTKNANNLSYYNQLLLQAKK
jgi:tetratricopeptide (TPR) repeat protein